MTNDQGPTSSSAPVSRKLWQRASELDQELSEPKDSPAPSAAETDQLPVPELLEVAREVGISADSVLLSVAEGRLVDGGELRPGRKSPLWHQVLVETVDALEASLHLPQDPSAAARLLREVLARPEYRMELEDRIEVEASGESVSVFRAGEAVGSFGGSSFHATMLLADGRVLLASVAAVEGGGSRLRLRMPAYERGMNLALSTGAGGLGGLGGLSAGAALGEAVVAAAVGGATGLLPLAGVVVPAVLGAYVGAGAGILAFRRLQKWGFSKGQTALNRLARVLDMEAREGSEKESLPPG